MSQGSPNLQLKGARLAKNWTQSEACQAAGVADITTWQRWERGTYSPSHYYRRKICALFNKTPEELGFLAEEQIENTSIIIVSKKQEILLPTATNRYSEEESQDWATWFGVRQAQIFAMINIWSRQAFLHDEIQTMINQEIKAMDEALNQYEAQEQQGISRRQALITIAALPTTLLSYSRGVAPDMIAQEFLPQCSASVTACWHLLNTKGLTAVNEILPKYVPLLTTIALRPSKYQQEAARIATQTSILQAIIAMHRLNFTAREGHCKDAIRYSKISGDNKLQAAALMYLGYTLSFCYQPRQPEKAISVFLEGLHILGNDDSLIKSDILMGLGEAYAQCNDEQNALYYLGLAHNHFPSDPELDPSYTYAECGLTTLYQWEGKTYLELVEYQSDRGYQKKASKALLQSIGASSLSARCTNETLVYQADAARVLGELEIYTDTLTQAAAMAIEIGSKKRYNEVLQIYQRTPEKWFREPAIKVLSKDVFKQLPRIN